VDLLNFNRQTCTQCGLCAAVCMGEFIDFRKNRFPVQVPEADRGCSRCGHCVVICPSGSLTLRDVPEEQCVALDSSLDISFAQAAQLIKGRRSIREYKDKPVPTAEIERIIEVARYAPTGHNEQEVRWLVITHPATLKRLSEIGLDWMRWGIKNIPRLSYVLARIVKLQESGKDAFLRNAPAVVITYGPQNSVITSIDCINAAAYFDLAATRAGLGCCWNGLVLSAAVSFPAMIDALALPDGSTPYGCLMLGYPKYSYHRAPARQPAQIIYRA
jgi:nitroreductase/NAD-dependent dihydropyrimidine dehydrogenase PreA subunit